MRFPFVIYRQRWRSPVSFYWRGFKKPDPRLAEALPTLMTSARFMAEHMGTMTTTAPTANKWSEVRLAGPAKEPPNGQHE